MFCLNIVSAVNYLHKDQTVKTWLIPKHWLSQYIISIFSFFLYCYCTSFRYITWRTNEKYQHSISARFSLHSLNISSVIYQKILIFVLPFKILARYCVFVYWYRIIVMSTIWQCHRSFNWLTMKQLQKMMSPCLDFKVILLDYLILSYINRQTQSILHAGKNDEIITMKTSKS